MLILSLSECLLVFKTFYRSTTYNFKGLPRKAYYSNDLHNNDWNCTATKTLAKTKLIRAAKTIIAGSQP